MREVEVSRTLVSDARRRARAFFEALIADNLDIGRPANAEIIFGRRVRRDTQGVFRTAIDRPAVGPDTGGVVLNLFYKHSRIKQYLKDGVSRTRWLTPSKPICVATRRRERPRRHAGASRPSHRVCVKRLG